MTRFWRSFSSEHAYGSSMTWTVRQHSSWHIPMHLFVTFRSADSLIRVAPCDMCADSLERRLSPSVQNAGGRLTLSLITRGSQCQALRPPDSLSQSLADRLLPRPSIRSSSSLNAPRRVLVNCYDSFADRAGKPFETVDERSRHECQSRVESPRFHFAREVMVGRPCKTGHRREGGDVLRCDSNYPAHVMDSLFKEAEDGLVFWSIVGFSQSSSGRSL